jgi:hypothetical protein
VSLHLKMKRKRPKRGSHLLRVKRVRSRMGDWLNLKFWRDPNTRTIRGEIPGIRSPSVPRGVKFILIQMLRGRLALRQDLHLKI